MNVVTIKGKKTFAHIGRFGFPYKQKRKWTANVSTLRFHTPPANTQTKQHSQSRIRESGGSLPRLGFKKVGLRKYFELSRNHPLTATSVFEFPHHHPGMDLELSELQVNTLLYQIQC